MRLLLYSLFPHVRVQIIAFVKIRFSPVFAWSSGLRYPGFCCQICCLDAVINGEVLCSGSESERCDRETDTVSQCSNIEGGQVDLSHLRKCHLQHVI